VISIGFGVLGLHPWEFDRYYMDEFNLKLKGFYDHQHSVQKLNYRHMRILFWQSTRVHLQPKDQRKMDKYMPDIYEKAKLVDKDAEKKKVADVLARAKKANEKFNLLLANKLKNSDGRSV
jgi:hypothetical protein